MVDENLREAYRQFTTGVALITTHGRRGPNVMAAEWTFNVSYRPFLISVHIRPDEATHEAIVETGEFGVNIASEDQTAAMAFAGHFSRYDVDKLTSELFDTYPARVIKAPMIRGCLLNAECRVVKQVPLGDHTALVGEVIEFSVDRSKRPVVLHQGARRIGSRIRRKVTVAVAAASREASPGSTVAVLGELASPSRACRLMRISLIDPAGRRLASEAARTDSEGKFQGKVRVPQDAAEGMYVITARYRGVEGTARLRVVER